jgi:hypothetical protein
MMQAVKGELNRLYNTKSRMKNRFSSILDLNVRKRVIKCYIWSIALCDAETLTFRKFSQKYLESFKMCCWGRMEKISWNDCVKNEVLQRVKEETNILRTLKKKEG